MLYTRCYGLSDPAPAFFDRMRRKVSAYDCRNSSGSLPRSTPEWRVSALRCAPEGFGVFLAPGNRCAVPRTSGSLTHRI